MRTGSRIKAIYTKELVELLRDRRTLIAMIVVPIALYPLLIIGSVHLLTVQDSARQFHPLRIAVPDPEAGGKLSETAGFAKWAITSADRLYREAAREEHRIVEDDEGVQSIEKMSLVPVADVGEAVSSGRFLVGLEAYAEETSGTEFKRFIVTPVYDQAEISSESALKRMLDIFDTVKAHEQLNLLEAFHTPAFVLEPLVVEPRNVASPKKIGGMVLGSIVPLVLVLMTITGAIYPAIDLTAGERERGTLETLIVAPVPPMELITGKYLVVTTVALMGAALNLLSMGGTLYFGGFTEMIGSAGTTELPLGVLPIILVALIPFALLFSAVMVAVCSYARTFKEAQNYIMPVILAALIPGGIAAMPGTEFAGVRTVVPVMNMVLMARELLLGNYAWGKIVLVLLSTSFYAGTAVVIASRVFSTEAVVFADSASLRSVLQRRLIKASPKPTVSLALIVTAVLFPVWMFVQFAIQPRGEESILQTFSSTALYMPLCLIAVPWLILAYFKIDRKQTFGFSLPAPRYWLGALLIGAAAWIPAHELFVLQHAISPVPEAITQSNGLMQDAFAGRSLWTPLLLIAIVPAICEELFFRGFVLSGLSSTRKWTAILITAAVFGVFHFLLVKFALTAGLGILLGYLCWQAKSIAPAILAHMLHNGTAVLLVMWPPYRQLLGLDGLAPMDHLPMWLIAAGSTLVIAGIATCRRT